MMIADDSCVLSKHCGLVADVVLKKTNCDSTEGEKTRQMGRAEIEEANQAIVSKSEAFESLFGVDRLKLVKTLMIMFVVPLVYGAFLRANELIFLPLSTLSELIESIPEKNEARGRSFSRTAKNIRFLGHGRQKYKEMWQLKKFGASAKLTVNSVTSPFVSRLTAALILNFRIWINFSKMTQP
jgi:hypothetical protein